MRAGILSALLVLMVSSAAYGTASKKLPFINDDFQKALKEGKQRNLPLFVEVWAPW